MTVVYTRIDLTFPNRSRSIPNEIRKAVHGDSELDHYILYFDDFRLTLTIEMLQNILNELQLMKRNGIKKLDDSKRKEIERAIKSAGLQPPVPDWIIDYRIMVAKRIKQLKGN